MKGAARQAGYSAAWIRDHSYDNANCDADGCVGHTDAGVLHVLGVHGDPVATITLVPLDK